MKKQISVLIALIAILGILSIQTSQAQSYKHKLANKSKNSVDFVLVSPVNIEGYDGNQIIIKNTNYQAPSKPPKRAKGLHAIGGSSRGNSGIGLSVHKENSTLKVVQTGAREGEFMVKVPNKVHINFQQGRARAFDGDIHIKNYKGEIEVKTTNGDINLQNITGPVVAHSSFGNINIVFSHLSNIAPSSILTSSGHIDVSLPASSKADLKLSSHRDIYTDFNISMNNNKNNLIHIGGSYFKDTLNGGGVELSLNASFGNIYLRKK